MSGLKRVQIEPHLSVTGAASAEWVPIRPKTDAAFLFGVIHVLLHASRANGSTCPSSRHHRSPYLVGPNGYFLRDPATRKPLIWDLGDQARRPVRHAGAEPALEGRFTVDASRSAPTASPGRSRR